MKASVYEVLDLCRKLSPNDNAAKSFTDMLTDMQKHGESSEYMIKALVEKLHTGFSAGNW